jgi:hypothetical protein
MRRYLETVCLVLAGALIAARLVWAKARRGLLPLALAGGVLFLVPLLNHYLRWHAQGGLEVPEHCLDLGTVWEQDQFPWDLVIYNHNTTAVQLTGFQVSCAHCITITPPAVTLPPQGTARLHLTLDLRRAPNASTPITPFRVSIMPIMAHRQTPLRPWQLHGYVQSAVLFSPPAVDFQQTPLLQGQSATQTLSAIPTVPLRTLRLTAAPPGVSVTVRPSPKADAFLLQVTAGPTLAVGEHMQILRFTPIRADGTALPQVSLPFRPLVLADVRVEPQQLWLLPQAASAPVWVSSRSGRPICRVHAREIPRAAPPGLILITPSEKPTPNSCLFILTAQHLPPQIYNTTVRFTVQLEGLPQPAEADCLVFWGNAPQEVGTTPHQGEN